jgi:hypothetical protein
MCELKATSEIKQISKESKVFRSCFWGHKWTKWEQQNVEVRHISGGQSYKGFNTIQTRRCLRCNKMQTEDI